MHNSLTTEFKKGQRASENTIRASAERFKKLNKDPEFIRKRLKGLCRRPTEPERKLIEIIARHNLPFKYTGDGSFIIGNLNPDFVNVDGGKVALDVFGDYWHTLKAKMECYNEEGRKRIFAEYGWELVVIWEREINCLSEQEILHKIML
jgi:G:T-mismatch repair DNA endonuclease (very short patch repair protein)